MIKFILIQGEVEILEKDKPTVKAKQGMIVSHKGRNLVIKAGPAARATLTIDEEPVELMHDSLIRVRPDGRTFKQKVSKELKLFFGRVWQIVDNEFGTDREEIVGNSAPGVRG